MRIGPQDKSYRRSIQETKHKGLCDDNKKRRSS